MTDISDAVERSWLRLGLGNKTTWLGSGASSIAGKYCTLPILTTPTLTFLALLTLKGSFQKWIWRGTHSIKHERKGSHACEQATLHVESDDRLSLWNSLFCEYLEPEAFQDHLRNYTFLYLFLQWLTSWPNRYGSLLLRRMRFSREKINHQKPGCVYVCVMLLCDVECRLQAGCLG